MSEYIPLEHAGQRLNASLETIRGLEEYGWIYTVSKNGQSFLPSQQEYKAKFILFLRRVKKLNDRQIGEVLSVQQPPYSAKDVDRILVDRGIKN